MRIDGREINELRPVTIERGVNKYAEGSALITCGDTKVLCTASVLPRVPRWLRGAGRGWVTAEYQMLPRATKDRNQREAVRGKLSGRSQEIQRLIGRGLRQAVDLEALGEVAITLDCDVLQADGGTRTASITGAYVALVEAIAGMWNGEGPFPVKDFCAAVSVGELAGVPHLDLCYEEDSTADVDMNVVALQSGELVEVQGTGEGATFSRAQLNDLLDLAQKGISELIAAQQAALGDLADLVGSVGRRGILLATHNEGKIREMQAMLAEVGYQGIPVAEVADLPDPEETGTTFAENALIKARYYMEKTGLPALADDSGLAVDALDGAPGVYSARYAGTHGDDAANNAKLVKEMTSVDPQDRGAEYVCELALVYPDGTKRTARGICRGEIVLEPRGTEGFGYDPYFYLPEREKTMAELTLAEKNRISHRGEALRILSERLREQSE